MAVDHYPTQEYEGPVHGELITDGNSATLTVIKLYQDGTNTEIAALGA